MWSPSLSSELSAAVDTLDNVSNQRNGHYSHITQIPVTKVSQLDGELLDCELQNLMKQQLDGALKCLPQYQSVFARIQPELNAFVRFILWCFSHRTNNPSPGNLLQNLRYRNELVYYQTSLGGSYLPMLLKVNGDEPLRIQRFLHGIGTVLIPYAFDRIKNAALISQWSSLPENDYRKKISEWIDKLEKLWNVLQVLNLFSFLYSGKYRSLLDRILFMRLVYDKVEGGRDVAFEFINQQLLYDGFSNMLIAILPIIDWARFQRVWLRLQSLSKSFLYSLEKRIPVITFRGKRIYAGNANHGEKEDENTQVSDAKGNPITCAFCSEEPCMAYEIDCGHRYCYYCLQSHFMANPNMTCHICNTLVTSSRRT